MVGDLAAQCRRFFDAIERHDAATIRTLIAPGGVLSRNGGAETPLDAMSDSKVLARLERQFGPHRYEDIRQVVGQDAVAEQHRFRSTALDGTVYDADVCVVMRFDSEGRIVRLDEYGSSQ